MTATLDPFILERAPGPTVEVDPALLRARVDDSALTYAWKWDGKDVDVRYAFYRVLETIESATSTLTRAVSGSASSEARDAVAATTAARWETQGILATLNDADLDADPG